MKLSLQTRPYLGIEVLEARIAPAAILIQAGQLGSQVGEVDYNDNDSPAEDAVFVNTEADPTDPISAIVGPGVAGVADTFYAKLSPNTILKVFGGTGFQPLISGNVGGTTGTIGTIIAFFVDRNNDNEVSANELTGLALSSNVRAIISGTVDGDVVTNYSATFDKLGGSGETAGTATDLLKNPISKVSISGDVTGSVITGGKIKNLQIGGRVTNILAGTAANGFTYDFNTAGIADGGDTLVVAAPAAKVAGVSITNTSVGSLDRAEDPDDVNDPNDTVAPGIPIGIIRAGDGGAAAAGGKLSGITVLADRDGFTLQAGEGGDGAAGSGKGGRGGSVTNVLINGLDAGESDASLNDQITIQSGAGGDAFSSTAKGGDGGKMSGVFVGFERLAGQNAPARSVTPVSDQVTLQSGAGGAGFTGGAGGLITKASLFAAPTGSGSELMIMGGNGGATNIASNAAKAGAGASVVGVSFLNPATNANGALVTIDAGDGGAATVGGKGANGGSITNATITSFSQKLSAGNGSTGTVGGNGGSITTVISREGSDGVRTNNLDLDAGAGGVGIDGKGGKGGNVSAISVRNGDLALLRINLTAGAGDGGDSQSGKGARGGLVKGVNVTELGGALGGLVGTATIRGGNGGDGGNIGAGGSGGSVKSVLLQNQVELSLTATGGQGGNATLSGSGGKGGSLQGVSFFSAQEDPGLAGAVGVTAVLTGGMGGNGLLNGAGGAGGSIIRASLGAGSTRENLVNGTETTFVGGGDLTLTAGLGGNGGNNGAAGAGGSVLTSSVLTFAGAVTVTAANAGSGVKAGAGGDIKNLSVDVGTSVTLRAGNGSAGGTGGDITNIGYSRAVEDSSLQGGLIAAAGSAPTGSVTLVAGTGSGAGAKAGSGGAISGISGFVGLSGTTTFRAGDGGSVATKAATGGSITNVSLFGGGGAGVEVLIQAGDGASATAADGANGGSVRQVGIGVNSFDSANPQNTDNAFAIDPATIIRHVAAGNGGDSGLSNGDGGRGGSVVGLSSRADIGVRSGEGFGFDTMGGIFAGSGGINTNFLGTAETAGARSGAAGNVINVTADAIASIVAGRPVEGSVLSIRNLVTRVDSVILNDFQNPTIVDGTGTFLNFDTASLIGGVVDPTAPGDDYDPSTPPNLGTHANTIDVGEFTDTDASGGLSLGDGVTAATDGFVAAISFINNQRNVRPEAFLTVQGGQSVFVDLNNLNGQRVV